MLRAAFVLLRLFKGVPTVLKSKNSESNMDCGHIHKAEELITLSSTGRAGAASWDLTGHGDTCSLHLHLFMALLRVFSAKDGGFELAGSDKLPATFSGQSSKVLW